MRQSMQSAMFGAMNSEHRLDMIANNLANANTTGYKKDRVAFHDVFQRFAHDYLNDSRTFLRDKSLWPEAHVMAKPRLSDERIDFSQGSLEETGDPLDFALHGDGFFRVQTPEGMFYTRAGNFELTADGRVITPQGFELLTAGGGPLTIPPGSGTPQVDSSGQVSVNGGVIAQIGVTGISDLTAMEKVGNNLYRIREGADAQEVAAPDTQVEQGFTEKANVEIVTEMVSMIEVQRAFEMYQKMMQSTDGMESQIITKVGRVS